MGQIPIVDSLETLKFSSLMTSLSLILKFPHGKSPMGNPPFVDGAVPHFDRWKVQEEIAETSSRASQDKSRCRRVVTPKME